MKRISLLVALALIATASAHTAAPPKSHEVRLLHDCNDDYFGGDALGSNQGHELHALDLYEAWDENLGNTVVFRLTFAGEGAGTIQLETQAGSSSKSYEWTTTGSTWSGTFDRVEGPFQAKTADGADDGDRLVIHGIVKQSKLGAIGAKLSGYSVQSSQGGQDADSMPGYDGNIAGSCSDQFERPDYSLAGPIQFASLALDSKSVSLDDGEKKFIQVTVSNKLRDQAQTVTISANGGQGVDVQMHNSATNAYSDELSLDLNKKGSGSDSKVAHVSISATAPGNGVIEVILTTEAGGRVTETLQYDVVGKEPSSSPTSSSGASNNDVETKGTPGAGVWAVLGILGIALLSRRS